MNKKNTSNPSLEELGHSPDALAQRKDELLALLAQNAPELISDNQLNVVKLQELLGEDYVAPEEHYELSWAGKTAARREIQKTSSHTLRPDANNPAQAQHMLIEGENLEVLRVLQKSYYGKVKMIYIDPPYNTGSDSFVYPDNYSETLDEYQRRTGEKNEAGFLNKQSLWKKNSKESGQYHSAWLSMMYPRLYLARNLLRDDGVIFISIDDNEAANLKLLCDEVFGAENFVAPLVWKSRQIVDSRNQNNASIDHEQILVYSKTNTRFSLQGKKISEAKYSNPDDDPRGPWMSNSMLGLANASQRPNLHYSIVDPETGLSFECPSDSGWRYSRETMKQKIEDGRVIFPKTPNGRPREKKYLLELTSDFTGFSSILPIDIGFTLNGSREVREILGEKFFDFPKPVSLIKELISQGGEKECVVVDFFAGSGTTTHAVMELNHEDGGNRQSISVQMPEVLDEISEAYKAGYRTIADITRARIEKVMAKLKAEHAEKTADLACAYFTLAPSNFKVWQGDLSTSEALREQLSIFQSAEKGGQGKHADAQTAMLTELLLKLGLGALGVHAISKPRELAGVTIHRVLMADDKTMWLCFEPYTDNLKDEIVKSMPAQVVMLNTCFVGAKADEQLANLQLELAGLDIGLTVI